MKQLPLVGIIISLVAWTLAVLHTKCIVHIDTIALALIGVGAVPWLFPFLKSWKGPFGEFEFKERLEQMEQKVEVIEKHAPLPGRKSSYTGGSSVDVFGVAPDVTSRTVPPSTRGAEPTTIDPDDPNRGQFGGSPESNGRILGSEIEPLENKRSSGCRIVLTVRSSDPAKPLLGEVTLYLHPTFGRWKKYPVKVKNGMVSEEITAWGVFTVGAVADGGRTKLELNLANVHGGTKSFYEN